MLKICEKALQRPHRQELLQEIRSDLWEHSHCCDRLLKNKDFFEKRAAKSTFSSILAAVAVIL
jgi:hypothetical protein